MAKKNTPAPKAKPTITHQAISFSPHRIVAISTTKGKLQQIQAPLPNGAIVNGEIIDLQTVTVQLQQLVKQLPMGTSGIVLGIPEHQTFVKQIIVDNNFVIEKLKEQMYAEVEQYFDADSEEIHADWTLITSDHREGQLIQLAAIPHRLAEQYVYLLRESKLKTVAIEPPSLTLSRIVSELVHPCLIIEAETITNLALSSYSKAVDFTSVYELEPENPQYTSDFNEHISQMVKYYQFKYGKELQKIYVTGSLATQCQAAIQTSIPVELLDQQTHVLSYALAEKPVTPPDDPQTINLIPVNLQEDYHATSSERFTAKLINISMIFLLILNMVAAGFLLTVFQKQISLNSQAPVNTAGASITAAGQLSRLQNQIQTVNYVGPLRDDYVQLWEIIKPHITTDIQLTNMSMATVEHQVMLSGISQNQDAILELKQKLEQQPQFTQVKLPLSIFAQQQEIPFTFTIIWTPDPKI